MVKSINEAYIMFDKWRNYATEDIRDVSYSQRLYQSYFVLSVQKTLGGDKTEKMSEIRSIPNVTTVVRETEISETETILRAIYRIRFVLEGTENVKSFIQSILLPEMQKIKGLQIDHYKGFEELRRSKQ